MKNINSFIRSLYHHPWITIFFPTTVSNLQRELADCSSVIDLGCGPDSPLQYCPSIKTSIGVEAYQPYLEKTKKKKIHTQYLNRNIQDLAFADNSVDAVILIEVLEHLSTEEGQKIIAQAKKWAKKKVIITTPNGFVHQMSLDHNPLQEHLSGWTTSDFARLSFSIRGLSGLKILRQEVGNGTMGDDLTTSIRLRPKLFWFVIASLSQVFTNFFPKFAFELFCVYHKRS